MNVGLNNEFRSFQPLLVALMEYLEFRVHRAFP